MINMVQILTDYYGEQYQCDPKVRAIFVAPKDLAGRVQIRINNDHISIVELCTKEYHYDKIHYTDPEFFPRISKFLEKWIGT